MTTRSSFTDEEWTTVFQAPMMAGMAVMMTAKSGPIQIAQEMFAVGAALAEADRTSTNPLLKALAEAVKAGEKPANLAEQPKSVEAAQTLAIDNLRAAAAIVDAKLPAEEAQEFKRWLVDVSQKVAEASKEGAFLGIGGTQVTDEERTAVDTVATTLGVPRA
jgi:hypothetical protein